MCAAVGVLRTIGRGRSTLSAVEQRLAATQTEQPIEWLADNGSAYIDHRTRSFARALGLEPLTTPVTSPQSDDMAESFVNTMKHDYVIYGQARRATGAIAPGMSVCPDLQRQTQPPIVPASRHP